MDNILESSKECLNRIPESDREDEEDYNENVQENGTDFEVEFLSRSNDDNVSVELVNEGEERNDIRNRRLDDIDKSQYLDGEQGTYQSKVNLSVDRFSFYHKKRHKRKQPRPRSICETEASDPEELNTEQTKQHNISNEIKEDEGAESKDRRIDSEDKTSVEIKQRPLCSKLCIRKERRIQKSPVRKEPTITSKEISEIINATNENTTSPCTTNRYRRHFLKQLRKAEARRIKEAAKTETANSAEDVKDDKSESDVQVLDISNEDVESEDDYSLDGKKIKIDKVGKGDETECNICQKRFTDVGTFMAHYICHSSFEKEHAGRMSLKRDVGGCEGSGDGSEVRAPSRASDSRESTSAELLGDSTYFCQVCNQRFNNITSLQSHMSCHSGDEEGGSDGKREFYCHLCHKKFASAGSLHVHNKIHTGDNPYTCLKCKKSFRDKTRLTTHIRVHTGRYIISPLSFGKFTSEIFGYFMSGQ